MAILEKEVLVGSGGKNVKFYESLGYNFPRHRDRHDRHKVKRGTKILVKINDLSLSCSVKLTKICDDCGKQVPDQPYYLIINGRKKQKDGLDRCHQCSARNNGNSLSIASKDNCVANVDREFAKIFWNKEETYKYSCRSGKHIDFKCLNCGAIIKNKRIADIYVRGLRCPSCSDGISYPEKFIYNLLDQLDMNFEIQKTFFWSESKRYDFYIPALNMIIETHGRQHYEEGFIHLGGKPLEEEQKNDRLKEKIAKENGIEHYIIIDCRESNVEYIKNSILRSNLSNLLNIEGVNWKECDKNASNSLLKTVCEIWKNGVKDPKKISILTNLSLSAVYTYLNKGANIGFCDYDGENTSSVVQLSLNMELISEFESISEASKITGADGSAISKVCKRKLKKTGGYHWMYKGDYIDYKTNNEYKNEFDEFLGYNSSKVKVIKVETGEVFNSISVAAELNKISTGAISNVCRRRYGCKSAGGFRWMYKEDYDRYIEQKNKELKCV